MKKILPAILMILFFSGCIIEDGLSDASFVTEDAHEESHAAIDNESAEQSQQLYDRDGRLTGYARSQRHGMFSPDFDRLPKVHPEDYGNNYYEPGEYRVRVGDGFGKGDFLIKFVEFIPQNESVEGQIKFEVFKKESDGNYYHFPTEEDTISRYSYTDIYGIVIESPLFSWQINSQENPLVYHPNCTVFFDYCDDENGHYTGDYLKCSGRCEFDAFANETKVQQGIFSAVYSDEYEDMAEFSADLLERCYNKNVDFLGYDSGKERIGMKVYSGEKSSEIIGSDETITAGRTNDYLDLIRLKMDYYNDEKERRGCISYMRVGHELTHIMTKEVFGKNYVIMEGIAEFVEFHNNGSGNKFVCMDNGWHYVLDETVKPYTPISSSTGVNVMPAEDFYATGFCFFRDFTDEYGYPKFVLLVQELQQKGRGIDDFYVLDVMEEVIGGPLSEEIVERYSLTRDCTYVELCNNCGIFTS